MRDVELTLGRVAAEPRGSFPALALVKAPAINEFAVGSDRRFITAPLIRGSVTAVITRRLPRDRIGIGAVAQGCALLLQRREPGLLGELEQAHEPTTSGPGHWD